MRRLMSILSPFVLVGALASTAHAKGSAHPAPSKKDIEVHGLRAQVQALTRQLTATRAELHKSDVRANQRVAELSGRLDASSAQVKQLTRQVVALKAQSSTQGSNLTATFNQGDAVIQNQVNDLRKRNQAQNARIDALTSEIEALKKQQK